MTSAACPTCAKRFAAAGPGSGAFPFCSARCRDADLGRWFAQEYRVESAGRPAGEGDGPADPFADPEAQADAAEADGWG